MKYTLPFLLQQCAVVSLCLLLLSLVIQSCMEDQCHPHAWRTSLIPMHGGPVSSPCMEDQSHPHAWRTSLIPMHGGPVSSPCMEDQSHPHAWRTSLIPMHGGPVSSSCMHDGVYSQLKSIMQHPFFTHVVCLYPVSPAMQGVIMIGPSTNRWRGD